MDQLGKEKEANKSTTININTHPEIAREIKGRLELPRRDTKEIHIGAARSRHPEDLSELPTISGEKSKAESLAITFQNK